MSQSGLINSSGTPVVQTVYDENNGSATPSANVLNVLGSNGITTSGSGNTITVTLPNPVIFVWTIMVSDQNAVTGNGYFTDSTFTLTLPVTSAIGDTFEVFATASNSVIAQNAGQSIQIGISSTTVGVTGNLTSQLPAWTKLVCDVANTHWNAVNGAWTAN